MKVSPFSLSSLVMIGMLPLLSFSLAGQSTTNNTAYHHSFRLKNNMILVQAKVNNQAGYFILDTGSPFMILHQDYFSSQRNIINMYAINGECVTNGTTLVDIELGPWLLKNKLAQIADLAPLEERLGVPIHGLLGMKILQLFELEIDFKSTQISFHLLDRKGNRRGEKSDLEEMLTLIPFHQQQHLSVVEVRMGNNNYQMVLDTGAGINLLNAKYQNLFTDTTHQFRNSQIRGVGQTTDNKKRMNINLQAHLNNHSTGLMPTLLVDMQQFNRQLTGPDVDGLLGFSFFSQQKIRINFRRAELHLWPIPPHSTNRQTTIEMIAGQ